VSSFMLRFVTDLGNVFSEKRCLNNSSCSYASGSLLRVFSRNSAHSH